MQKFTTLVLCQEWQAMKKNIISISAPKQQSAMFWSHNHKWEKLKVGQNDRFHIVLLDVLNKTYMSLFEPSFSHCGRLSEC